jgi:hypothetical protein
LKPSADDYTLAQMQGLDVWKSSGERIAKPINFSCVIL